MELSPGSSSPNIELWAQQSVLSLCHRLPLRGSKTLSQGSPVSSGWFWVSHPSTRPFEVASPGHPTPRSPSWPWLRAGGVRREQAVASTQGASSGVGTAAACPFSPDTSVASPLTACCPGFSPFTAVFFLPLPLSLSSSSSSLFLSLSGGVSLHAFLLPLLVLLLPLPPLLGTSSSQPRLHPLSLLCLPPCPPPVLPEGGGGLELPPLRAEGSP